MLHLLLFKEDSSRLFREDFGEIKCVLMVGNVGLGAMKPRLHASGALRAEVAFLDSGFRRNDKRKRALGFVPLESALGR